MYANHVYKHTCIHVIITKLKLVLLTTFFGPLHDGYSAENEPTHITYDERAMMIKL